MAMSDTCWGEDTPEGLWLMGDPHWERGTKEQYGRKPLIIEC